MEQNEKIGYKDIFKQKEYMKMMVAALINRFGDSIDAIASTWIVYELTGSAVWSAVIFGVNKVPSVFVTPLAGAWVEGRNKKAIMIITDLIRAVCVAFVASGYLLGFLQPWMLLVTTCIISTVEAFRGPAGSALTPRVLQAEYYEYGMSLMSTFSSVTELAGNYGGRRYYRCDWSRWCNLSGYGNISFVCIDHLLCEYQRREKQITDF